MSKRIHCLLVALCGALLLPAITVAQDAAPVLTYLAERSVPLDQWVPEPAPGEPPPRPVLQQLVADGTIVSWGEFSAVVHSQNRATHGTWWSARSIAALERVRAGLLKLPPGTEPVATTHHDHLFRALVHRGRTTGQTAGYLWMSSAQVQPGKGQQWRELWEKYTQPVYEELLANGTVLMYEVAVEEVHTEDPGWRHIFYVTPSAEAMDTVRSTFRARTQKRTPEETLAIAEAFAEVLVPGAHRDFFARLLNYAHQ